MAQFDVFENANSDSAGQSPYLLEVQSNIFVDSRVASVETDSDKVIAALDLFFFKIPAVYAVVLFPESRAEQTL